MPPGKTPDHPDYRPPDPGGLGRPLSFDSQLALERTGLSHERTLMGWVRTCFSMIGFGFTIYTFFLGLDKPGEAGSALDQPKIMCLALTLGGSLFMALAVLQHYVAIKRLFTFGMQRQFALAIFAASIVCAAGIFGACVILIAK